MTIEERIADLEDMFQKFRISGTDGVSVAGGLQQGYIVNAKPGAVDSGDVTPPDVISGCTNPDAANFNPDATEEDGSCVFNGACCLIDGSCVSETEEMCNSDLGYFQGELTVCDPNPCPPCPAFHIDASLTYTFPDDCDSRSFWLPTPVLGEDSWDVEWRTVGEDVFCDSSHEYDVDCEYECCDLSVHSGSVRFTVILTDESGTGHPELWDLEVSVQNLENWCGVSPGFGPASAIIPLGTDPRGVQSVSVSLIGGPLITLTGTVTIT